MSTLSINDRLLEIAPESTILEALTQLGIELPTLCFDKRLKPYGGCRLCMVRVQQAENDGTTQLVAACNTFVASGMRIITHDEQLERLRKTNLQLLARDYPAEAWQRDPESEFNRWLSFYGLAQSLTGKSDPTKRDSSHTHLVIDMNQCITCLRCVRICDELQGQFVWRAAGRGEQTQIVSDAPAAFAGSSCVSCGACSDTCPTGAIVDRKSPGNRPVDAITRTTCPYCGVGCEMDVKVSSNRIVGIVPVFDSPVNRGHLCVKGRYAYQFVDADDRVGTPLWREQGRLVPCSWDEAYSRIVDQLSGIIAAHGPDSVGLLGSARATNEENYVAQKFARLVLGTNNVDCCARVCHTPTAAAMKLMLGTGAATNSFDDIESASSFLLCGTNATENHPVVGARIKQRVRAGAKLVVVDPRQTELASWATVHLALRPGTNIPLLNGIAAALFEEGLIDETFVARRVEGLDVFREFVTEFSPDRVAAICGVRSEDIRQAARIYGGAKPAMCFHGLGVTEHIQGTEGVMCLVNLALLTGNLGVRGGGINPLRGQNNVQGSAVMGCDPSVLTGSASIKEHRLDFERIWGAAIPQTKGLHLLAMMDAAMKGELKSLWVIGYDILLSNANQSSTRQALANLPFVIVQDLFLNETAREFASVFLPIASGFEKEGTYMNSERRISRVRKLLTTRGESRTDWQVLVDIAERFGKRHLFEFDSAESIWNEIRLVWPAVNGMTYERLERHGLQWPCPDQSHPGTPMLHADRFPIGEKATLQRIAFSPSPEAVDIDFPILLTTGRTLYQFNAGTMTQRTDNQQLRSEDLLDLNPQDAARLGCGDGDLVNVRSRYGQIKLACHITEMVKSGEAFCTFHSATESVNSITSPHRDNRVSTPEYKRTAVHLSKAEGSN